MSFMNEMKNTLNEDYNVSTTENGALGYRTTGKHLLDINFAVSSLRNESNEEIVKKFMLAYFEDKITSIKWLFFARDVREGLGERELFKVVFRDLCKNNPDEVKHLINMIPEYGRFDDMFCVIGTPYEERVINIVSLQLKEDLAYMKKNRPISLLAKWMPSINASSKDTIKLAKKIAKKLNMSQRTYRKILSDLRKHINIVERKMSKKEWDEINYEAVPSRANLIYNNAFLRNDEIRRREYLASLEKGEKKINSSVLYPHDIVHKYTNGYSVKNKDIALEEMWKALPVLGTTENTLVVADGSGSMSWGHIKGTKVTALSIANALAIYFAERCDGQFNNNYITFSSRPQLVDLSKGKDLREKIQIALQHNECSNTNIEAVFDLILKTACNKKMEQSELPKNVLIVSDMEFDNAQSSNNRSNSRLFKTIENKYKTCGYNMPRLIFWNVLSRTGTIPVKENENGVALVSGFSVNNMKMIMSSKTDPYECLLETLNSNRYKKIEEVLRNR